MQKHVAFIAIEVALLVTPMLFPTIPWELGVAAYSLAAVLLLYAAYLQWLAPKKALAGAYGDVPANSGAIRSLAISDGRHRLIGLLQSGELNAWGRTKGFPNLRQVPPNFWSNETLMFVEVDGEPMSYIGDGKDYRWRKAPADPVNARFYDIHFNKAQLQRYFPDRRF